MPLAFLAIAWLTLMTGINGNYTAVGQQMQADFPGFVGFLAGLIGIALFFRLIDMPNAGRVFLILVLVVYLMEHAGVLTALESLGANAANATATSANSGSSAATSSGNAAAAATSGAAGTSDATPLTTPANSGAIGSA